MDRPHFAYLFICQWAFGLLLLWAILSNAAVNTSVQKSLRDAAFNSVGYIVRGGIALSYGASSCNFSRNRRTVFQCIKVPSLYILACIFWVFFPLIAATLMGVDVVAHCGLICISRMTCGIEHLFTGLWAICVSRSEKCLF